VLCSLSRQRTKADVVVVVNNSFFDKKLQSDVYRENRLTIGLLSYLSGSVSRFEFATDIEARIANAIRKSSLRIHIVDRTEGIEKNMGKIRNAGLDYACNLIQDRDPHRSFVFFLDADCIVGRAFVSELAARFQGEIQFLAQPMIYFPWRYDQRIIETFAAYHIPLLASRVSEALIGASAARLGAPQLAATIHAWQSCQGFQELNEGEDFEAGRRLAAEFGCSFSGILETLVITQDRAYGSGFEAGARASSLRDADRMDALSVDNPLIHLIASLPLEQDRSRLQIAISLARKLGLRLETIDIQNVQDVYHEAAKQGIPPMLSDIPTIRAAISTALEALFDDAILIYGLMKDKVRHVVTVLEYLLTRDARPSTQSMCATKHGISEQLWEDAETREAYVELAASLLLAMQQINGISPTSP